MPELLNGTLDWVYSEELYGRGNYRGYWWSPDSSRIAFIQLDEKPVPEYTLVDDIPYHPEIERWDYPKAGDPNPTARLGIVAGIRRPRSVGRHVEVLRLPDRQRGLDTRQPRGRLSDPGPPADVARLESGGRWPQAPRPRS